MEENKEKQEQQQLAFNEIPAVKIKVSSTNQDVIVDHIELESKGYQIGDALGGMVELIKMAKKMKK